MAVMNTSVRWMHSGMQGAPVIDNNWGDLTAMLRACCVTGFNVRPIQSITCQGTKATIQCAGHGYVEHQVVQIENATPEGYNGAHRVVSVEGGNTLTIELETELPEAQAMPGQTLQMRTAPLGWESLFDDGGQKLVLRSTDPQSTKNVLRVDDSLPAGFSASRAKFGRVTMAQDMSDLDTFIGARAPFDPSAPTKNELPIGTSHSGWFKWYYATGGFNYSESASDIKNGARRWALFGDGRTFYVGSALGPTWSVFCPYHYGDIDSLHQPDAFASLLTATEYFHLNWSFPIRGSGSVASPYDDSGRALLRDYHATGGNVYCRPRSLDLGLDRNKFRSGTDGLINFPNGPGNGLLLHPVWLLQHNGHLRGKLRGVHHVLQKHSLGHMSIVDGVAGLPGRKVMLVEAYAGGDSGYGSLAFDITGPW